MNIINSIKRFVTKHYAPYKIDYYTTIEVPHGLFGREHKHVTVESHKSWTLRDALEWAACSLREEKVVIYKRHEEVARRGVVSEV